MRAAWLLGLLGLGVPGSDPAAVRHDLAMQAERADYFLALPATRALTLHVDAAAAPPKARILLRTPLPAGPHRLDLRVAGARPEQTIVVAMPVQRGRSTFDVTVTGAGRYDFGFWAEPVAPRDPQEHRFTVRGPTTTRFAVAFPDAPSR